MGAVGATSHRTAALPTPRIIARNIRTVLAVDFLK